MEKLQKMSRKERHKQLWLTLIFLLYIERKLSNNQLLLE